MLFTFITRFCPHFFTPSVPQQLNFRHILTVDLWEFFKEWSKACFFNISDLIIVNLLRNFIVKQVLGDRIYLKWIGKWLFKSVSVLLGLKFLLKWSFWTEGWVVDIECLWLKRNGLQNSLPPSQSPVFNSYFTFKMIIFKVIFFNLLLKVCFVSFQVYCSIRKSNLWKSIN